MDRLIILNRADVDGSQITDEMVFWLSAASIYRGSGKYFLDVNGTTHYLSQGGYATILEEMSTLNQERKEAMFKDF